LVDMEDQHTNEILVFEEKEKQLLKHTQYLQEQISHLQEK